VQPQEPSTGQIPPPVADPGIAAPPPNGAPRRSRARLWVALLGGIVVLLCLGGAGIVALLYNNATEIKRAAPDAVVDSFLGEYLANRDDKEASLYECKSGLDLAAIAAYRTDITQREKKYSVGISVTWSGLTVRTDGDKGTVTVTLTRTLSDQSGRDSATWRFDVADQDGWRVCRGTEVS
jgi:hypothetical protein